MKINEVTLSLFADYCKAFDTVDHKILLQKLHLLQFSHSSLHLMNSYLTKWEQFVRIDDKRFPLARVYYGVPQGIILRLYCLTFTIMIYQKVQLVNVFNLLTRYH